MNLNIYFSIKVYKAGSRDCSLWLLRVQLHELQHRWGLLKKCHWCRCQGSKYRKPEWFVELRSSFMPYSLSNLLLWFAQPCSRPTTHLTDDNLLTVSYRLCRFMMRKFISTGGSYHVKDGHMAQFSDLCDWAGEGQASLREIHEKFDNICKL